MRKTMLNEIVREMEESTRDIIRSHALTVLEDYRVGSVTLDEAAESIGALADMDKKRKLIAVAVGKTLVGEGGGE